MKVLARTAAFSAISAVLAMPVVSSADVMRIDPDGAGPQGTVNVTDFDWNQGIVLATDANPLSVGSNFTTLTQTRLAHFQNSGTDLNVNLNTNYEWTVVIAFEEKVTGIGVDGNGDIQATFAADPTNYPSKLEIYYNNGLQTNYLAGTGFATGTKILEASLTSASGGSYTLTNITDPLENLDRSGNGNQWVGTTTYSGYGSNDNFVFNVDITSINTAFFVDGANYTDFVMTFTTVSQATPFLTVDPSQQVYDALTASYNSSDIGTVNLAAIADGGGDDFIFQSDYSSSATIEAVPAPATLALLGVGLLGLRRKGRRAAA